MGQDPVLGMGPSCCCAAEWVWMHRESEKCSLSLTAQRWAMGIPPSPTKTPAQGHKKTRTAVLGYPLHPFSPEKILGDIVTPGR